MFYKIFWDLFVAHACLFLIFVFFGCKRPARFYCLLLVTGRAGDLGDRAPRRKDVARRTRTRRVRVPSARASRRLRSGAPRREDRRGPAGGPLAPVPRGGRSRSCDRRAGPGRAVGRDRGPPGACEPVAQPRCNGGRSKAAPCPRGARDNPAPLCAVARSPRN